MSRPPAPSGHHAGGLRLTAVPANPSIVVPVFVHPDACTQLDAERTAAIDAVFHSPVASRASPPFVPVTTTRWIVCSADPRYGAHLATFRGHLDTPTRTYSDALGRDLAVSEDNGAGTTPSLRVTTYEITGTAFDGTTYDLTLDQDLVADYFVMIRGSVAAPRTAGRRR